MDRRGTRARLLIAAAGLACLAASPADPPLRDARWLASTDRLEALTTAPAECLAPPADRAATSELVAIGRTAFRTPLLLGGQAARAGLSCSTCHRNGRGNPAFLFPGLSGAPGTADVTSSLMSAHRGDGQTNPKPIPDLAADPPKVSRDPRGRALERFIGGLIVEEFDGPEPSPTTLAGLAAYIRALSPERCGKPAPMTLQAELADLDAALSAAAAALNVDDAQAARLMIAGARASLGRIDERFGGRRAIRNADLELAAIQAAIDSRAPDSLQRIAVWRSGFDVLAAPLRVDEPGSLYDGAHLAAALGRQRH